MHPNVKDLTGNRYGRLTALEFVGTVKQFAQWRCVCDCDGKEVVVKSRDLVHGDTKSCGCLKNEQAYRMGKAAKTHGRYVGIPPTPEGISLKCILQRCYDENHPKNYLYSGNGITVCERWQGEGGYQNFVDEMGPCPVVDGKRWVIDRKDPTLGYYKDNCQWLPKAINDKKTRPNGSVRNILST